MIGHEAQSEKACDHYGTPGTFPVSKLDVPASQIGRQKYLGTSFCMLFASAVQDSKYDLMPTADANHERLKFCVLLHPLAFLQPVSVVFG
jgi:hypothetical protein